MPGWLSLAGSSRLRRESGRCEIQRHCIEQGTASIGQDRQGRGCPSFLFDTDRVFVYFIRNGIVRRIGASELGRFEAGLKDGTLYVDVFVR